jgi:hypothetical protein
MSNPLDTIIFEGKTSSDVFKEIYSNSKKKDKQINSLIAELKPLIQNIGDAPVVVPLNNSSNGSDSLLTDEELKQLQQIAEEVAQDEFKKQKK